MKEVIKVSIARVSFTLEKEAHRVLENYISELKEHYRGEQNWQEIIDDIEERIMELLVERGLRDRVVSVGDITSIIDILGHPKDIDVESGYYSDDSADSGSKGGINAPKKSRKLYRDVNNRVLGGVCSGLGAYIKIDAVAVRLVFLIIAFFATIVNFVMQFAIIRPNITIGGGAFGFMVVLYVICWIIIPPAKTVAQRCEMKGESLGVDDIKKRVEVGAKTMGNEMRDLSGGALGGFFRVFGRIIMVCIGILFLMLGFAGLVTGGLFCFGIEVFEDITAFGMLDYVELGVSNILWIKILGLLVWFLPCIGFIYSGVVMCFGIKTPKWRLGLIIFILWLVSFAAFISYAVKAASPYYNMEREYVTTDLPANYDTLYINMKDFVGKDYSKVIIEKHTDFLKLAYIKKTDNKKSEIINYPTVRIERCAVEPGDGFISHIDYRYNVYGGGALVGSVKLADIDRAFNIKDSLITVNYKIFNSDKKYSGESERLNIYIPDGTVVKWVDDNGQECNFMKSGIHKR